jgi:hypothetical protein
VRDTFAQKQTERNALRLPSQSLASPLITTPQVNQLEWMVSPEEQLRGNLPSGKLHQPVFGDR